MIVLALCAGVLALAVAIFVAFVVLALVIAGIALATFAIIRRIRKR